MTSRVITLSLLVDEYIDYKVLREATIINYRKIGRLFFKEMALQEKSVSEITSNHIIEFRNITLSRSKPVTWNNYLRHLRALFNFAVKQKYLTENPCADSSLKARCGKPLQKMVERQHVQQLKQYFNHSPTAPEPAWFWAIVFTTLYYTGMRRSQLIGLRWKDIDFDHRRILMCSNTSKSHHAWHIPIHPELKIKLEVLQRKTFDVKQRIHDEDQVFNVTLFNPGYAGNQLSQEQLTGLFRRVKNKTGIQVSAHRMRHTVATELLKDSMSHGSTPIALRVVQQLLGHRDITTTAGYLHADLDDLGRLIQRLPQL